MERYNLFMSDPSIHKKIEPYLSYFPDLPDLIQVELFEAGEKIVDSFGKILDLRCLVEGKAKITLVHDNGRSSIVDFLRTGDYIGELTLLEIERRPKDVIALSPCICLSLPIIHSKDILEKDADFLLRMSRFLAEKHLRRTWFYVKGLSYEFKNRLAAYILLTEHKGFYNQKHTETAEILSVSYRHLLYTMKEFQNLGYLEKSNKGYKIHRSALEALAKDINFE